MVVAVVIGAMAGALFGKGLFIALQYAVESFLYSRHRKIRAHRIKYVAEHLEGFEFLRELGRYEPQTVYAFSSMIHKGVPVEFIKEALDSLQDDIRNDRKVF